MKLQRAKKTSGSLQNFAVDQKGVKMSRSSQTATLSPTSPHYGARVCRRGKTLLTGNLPQCNVAARTLVTVYVSAQSYAFVQRPDSVEVLSITPTCRRTKECAARVNQSLAPPSPLTHTSANVFHSQAGLVQEALSPLSRWMLLKRRGRSSPPQHPRLCLNTFTTGTSAAEEPNLNFFA